jgi:acetylornithine deacetylase/succinyl-diaminopimelate desuccinylase-like protein
MQSIDGLVKLLYVLAAPQQTNNQKDSTMPKDLSKAQLYAFAERERQHYEALLKTFVEIPTVSVDPQHKLDIRKGVELAAETIHRFGAEVQIFETGGGYPIIQGVFGTGADLPTVTIYNHMDVQPASKETEPWDTEPFVFTRKGDRYFGRGTTDDKGPALAALFGARAAREAGVPVNIRLLWEFEEEIGSPNFEKGIKAVADQLSTGSVVVSDTVWVSRKRPACPSGEVGGAARNPLGELMKLACDIYDPVTGKVKVPGFYDDVDKPTKKELEDFMGSGFSVRAFKKDHLLKSLRTEDPLEVMKRIWTLPTFEIHGMVGGYTGPGLKSIVPPRAELKATCRLVPGQNPEKIARLIRSFVKERYKDVVVHVEGTAAPYKSATTGPLAEAVKRAVKFAFGREPVFVREGGTIGAIKTMEDVLKCPVMFLGLSLPEHGYHAPNENFDWQQASGGMVAFAKYFEEVSRLGRD